MNIILAVISGILTSVSFPTVFGNAEFPNLGFLAWFSLAPLFYALKDASPRKAFLLTFVSALIFYTVSLCWLYTALNTYGHLNPIASVCVLLTLTVMLAATVSLAPMFAAIVESKTGVARFWSLPFFWVAGELFRNYYPFGGFPWGSITNTQYAYLPLIQIVDIAGIYGLAFVMIAVNLWLAERPRFLSARSVFVTVLLAAAVVYGYAREWEVTRGKDNHASIRVALLQGNIPQDQKWQAGLEEEQLDPYKKLTASLKKSGVDLIVWPEASYPWPVPETANGIPQKTLGEPEAFVLMGATSSSGFGPNRFYYNSMLLLDKDGGVLGRYHKQHLVPFGEYVPARKILFFADKLTALAGDLKGGDSGQPLLFTDSYQIGGLVCYEDLFPEISRSAARRGADFLVAVTNDAWYGRSSAALQHLAISVFRAVENRMWMVKAANTGISAVIDSTGRIISKTRNFEGGMIVSNVELRKGASFYAKFGDWFAWGSVLVAVFLLIAAAYERIKRKI